MIFSIFNLFLYFRLSVQFPLLASSVRERPSSFLRAHHSLNSAFEGLATRRSEQDESYKELEWIYFHDGEEEKESNLPIESIDRVDETTNVLPLYPLGAVYLPTGLTVNYTLNNIEPRNIQMALDLQEVNQYNSRFCAVLYALDSGKVASIGTVLRVLDFQPQFDVFDTSKIVRIQLTCVAENLVEIEEILNPQVTSFEYRLKRSSEYIRARVRPILTPIPSPNPTTSEYYDGDADRWKEELKEIAENYRCVRDQYLVGTANNDLPPFARNRETLAKSLPLMTESSFMGYDDDDNDTFWNAAQIWQSLCQTVREGHQIFLSSDRNELMVEAALKKGGPLKLPIHIDDLEPGDRRKVNDLEVNAQEAWESIGLDPILDFQVLLTMTTHQDPLQRLSFFRCMIEREKVRLLSILMDGNNHSNLKSAQLEVPRKGAWFDETVWD